MRRKNDPLLGVAYLRRSKEQTESKLGLEAQRAMIEAWALRENVTIVAWREDDGVSGSVPGDKRLGLLQALSDLRTHAAGLLVVAKRDRLARDVSHACFIARDVALHGATIVAADGNGNGSEPAEALMRTLLDAFAEHERAMIRARTKSALAIKRARGEKTGGYPPYGFDAINGRLLPNEAEQAVITAIRELQRDGLTLAQIVRTLEGRRIFNRVGKPLHRKSVERILTHPHT